MGKRRSKRDSGRDARDDRPADRNEAGTGPESDKGAGFPSPRRIAVVMAVLGAIGGGTAVLWHRTARDAPVTPAVDAAPRKAGPAQLTEAEPNDSDAQAQEVKCPAEVRGTIGAGDRDQYRITVSDPGGHVLDAWLEGPAGLVMRVQQDGGKELARAAAPDRILDLGVSKGRFLVTVEGDGGDAGPAVAGDYRLHLDVQAWQKGLDWEPDDDPKHAQEMATLKHGDKELARFRAEGRWASRGDVDCYHFPLAVPPEGAMFRFELKPPPGVRARLWVLDVGNAEAKIKPKRLITIESRSPGEPVLVPALGGRSWEPYYTACTSAVAEESAGQRYRLDVTSFTPHGPFEFEPNGEPEIASALPRDVDVRGYLTEEDVDWFRISAGAPGRVGVRVTLPTGVDGELVLLDNAKRELGRTTGKGGETMKVAHEQAVFARVQVHGLGSVTATYEISAHTVPMGPLER